MAIRQSEQDIQLIDLSEKTAKPRVVREGFEVPSPTLDQRRADFIVDQLVDVDSRQQPRVLSQSVRPGTRVPAGTAVDLVLASKSDIPFDVLDNPHADLKGKNLTVADPVVENAPIRQLLLTFDDPANVPPADRQKLAAEFAKAGVRVDDADPTRSFDAAFNSFRGAVAFR